MHILILLQLARRHQVTTVLLLAGLDLLPGEASASITGNWDGWVSLSGTGYGVKYDGDLSDTNYGKFNGNAWGDKDSGWIDFSRAYVTVTPPACGTANGTTISAAPSSNPSTILCATG